MANKAGPKTNAPSPSSQSPYESLPGYSTGASSSSADVNHESSEGDALMGGQSEKFNRNPKYKDVWATFAFLGHLVVLLLLTVAGFRVTVPDTPDHDVPSRHLPNQRIHKTPTGADPTVPVGDYPKLSEAGPLFAVTVLGGLGFTVMYFMLMQKYARQLISASFIFNTAVAGLLAIIYLASGAMIPAIFALLYAGVHIFMYFAYRSRMEFAKVILNNVATITRAYPSLFVTGIIGAVSQTFWTLTWVISAIAAARLVQAFESDAAKYAVVTYIMFSMFWTSQVIKNVVHVTVSGVFATYYFTGIATADGTVVVPVRNPTLKSAKRALTTSFGSIAFGSLIVALIQTLRGILNTVRRNAQDDGNSALALAATCADCIMSVVEGLVAFINVYAYTQVAIFGKSYLEAGRDTWALLQARGLDLVINDDLTSGVIGLGGVLVAFLSGTLGYVIGLVKDFAPGMVWALAGCGFIAGLLQFWVLAEIVRSGVATTFVCLAEDPVALRRTKPQLYQQFMDSYPRSVVGGVDDV
ncbi:hypothetical protein PhCBS80983_g01548 [Powellomyces hirtus]|uniref:Protein PNS1 n=1 Tax=Powellomyces hirtus TaxID=109895 RepID=A0A507E9Q3_9FUNG|nr:hypothetical protein PhCBS80983_g01548 [Powellomyces hirtus]